MGNKMLRVMSMGLMCVAGACLGIFVKKVLVQHGAFDLEASDVAFIFFCGIVGGLVTFGNRGE